MCTGVIYLLICIIIILLKNINICILYIEYKHTDKKDKKKNTSKLKINLAMQNFSLACFGDQWGIFLFEQ